ncbi:MAG: translocation/assembly module TamB domain-containing protein [Verrucomicrobiota bacterium]
MKDWQFQSTTEIDPAASAGDIAAALSDSQLIPNGSGSRQPRRCKRWIWGVLGVLLLGLVWLDGPGLRWMAPRVATYLLSKSGLRGTFEIDGRLSRGLTVRNLRIEGDKQLASLSLKRLVLGYRLSGRIESLSIDGLRADFRLGIAKADQKPSVDLKKWVGNLQKLRGRLVPLELDLKIDGLDFTRAGKPVVRLASSQLTHHAGHDEFSFELGTITDAVGHQWPAQQSTFQWSQDRLTIARLDPLPGLSVHEVVLQLPVGGSPSFVAQVNLNDSRWMVQSSPGLESIHVDLDRGKLQIAEVAKRIGVVIPNATLSSLSLELNHVFPHPAATTGTLHLLLEDGNWKGNRLSRLSLDAQLRADRSSIAARGVGLGSEFSVEASAPVSRSETEIILGDVQGAFSIPELPKLLRELTTQPSRIDSEAEVPPSRIDGAFNLAMRRNHPHAATAEVVVKTQDSTLASPVTLTARWEIDQPLSAELALEGLNASATYQPKTASYQAAVELNQFDSGRISRWLKIFKVKPEGRVGLTGKWSGSGKLQVGEHRGHLSIEQATWSRSTLAPILASGEVRYDWPTSLEAKGFQLQTNRQSVILDANLADHSLELGRIRWSDGEQVIAEGNASLPLPESFSNWRETLIKDSRPVSVRFRSQVLSLGLIKAWSPAFEKIDSRSTGQLDLSVSGTYAAPKVDAVLELKGLRATAQPKLPAADLTLTLAGRDGRLELSGRATAPDFAPAVMSVVMPYHPSEWARHPDQFRGESLRGRIDFPRLDLSRFSSLMPAVDKISGIVTANADLSGTVNRPEAKGMIQLFKAGLRFKNDSFAAIENLAATVDLAIDRAVLNNLTGNVAGGGFRGEGTLAYAAGKPGTIDLRLRGDHLPLARNEIMILRVNADLRLQGPWQQAILSGTVGTVDSIFYRDIELLPIGMPFTTPRAAALPKIDAPRVSVGSLREPYRNWGLNLILRSLEPVLIRGNLAKGEISGRVRIGGTLGNPQPDGTVTLKDFRAALPFSTLSVRTGKATFTPATGFDPLLEIRGTAEPSPYQVTLFAYGRASNPQLVLTSSPPLPENEIMTLLATGTTTTGLENPQAASSRALQLLVEEMRRGRFRFGKQLRPLLALLDRVDFSVAETDPYSSESFSTATLSLTDRWFLSAGIGATGDSRMLAIWRLSFR